MDAILDWLTPEQREQFKPVAIELKAGECSFHHPLMVHGSHANETVRPRRAVVINAFRDGVVSASDAPLLRRRAADSEWREDGWTILPFIVPARSVCHQNVTTRSNNCDTLVSCCVFNARIKLKGDVT